MALASPAGYHVQVLATGVLTTGDKGHTRATHAAEKVPDRPAQTPITRRYQHTFAAGCCCQGLGSLPPAGASTPKHGLQCTEQKLQQRPAAPYLPTTSTTHAPSAQEVSAHRRGEGRATDRQAGRRLELLRACSTSTGVRSVRSGCLQQGEWKRVLGVGMPTSCGACLATCVGVAAGLPPAPPGACTPLPSLLAMPAASWPA